MGISGKITEHGWVPVTDPMFLKDAGIIEAVLAEEGIPAKVAERNPARYSNLAPQLKTGEVLVPVHLLEKALAILKAREAAAER